MPSGRVQLRMPELRVVLAFCTTNWMALYHYKVPKGVFISRVLSLNKALFKTQGSINAMELSCAPKVVGGPLAKYSMPL